jgi:sugar O-acyltransferase (sialic acid O-acetyltransferase NeuD family)
MTRYVMFGTHPMFGNYVDAIHSCGGILSRVVRNMEEPPRPPGERFEDRLERYHAWLDGQGIHHRVEVLPQEDFTPRDDEAFLFGFWGPKQLPLRDHLKRRFGLCFAPIIHASAYVSPMSRLGEGVVVGRGAIIGPNASIGDCTYVNSGAIIGHDCEVGSGVIIGAMAAIASRVRFACGVIVGIGATVLEDLTLGEESFIAAGAVVIKDVPAHVLVAGVPAVEKKPFFRQPLIVEPDPEGRGRYIVTASKSLR